MGFSIENNLALSGLLSSDKRMIPHQKLSKSIFYLYPDYSITQQNSKNISILFIPENLNTLSY